MKGIIIEGVAGTGKSTLLKKIRGCDFITDKKCVFISENETLGELFNELLSSRKSHSTYVKRLELVIDSIQKEQADFVFLERFHHSYYALGIEWNLLKPIDDLLFRLGFKTILLDLDDSDFESRCLKRPDHSAENWENDFIRLYGSEEKAIVAFKDSQERRRRMLKLSQLPSRLINTGQRRWDEVLRKVIQFSLVA